MNAETTDTTTTTTTTTPAAQDRTTGAGGRPTGGVRRLRETLWRWRGAGVWVVVAAVGLYAWWPMLKGAYYQSGAAAAAPADGIAWRTDLTAALDESRQTGRPVLIDFTASWCPPCTVMKHEVWPDARVRRAVADGYVPVLADVDSTGAAAAQAYGISTIPTLLVVDATGTVLRQASFVSADEMLAFLADPPTTRPADG